MFIFFFFNNQALVWYKKFLNLLFLFFLKYLECKVMSEILVVRKEK